MNTILIFFGGVFVGIFLATVVFPLFRKAKTEIIIHLPKPLYEEISTIGNLFDWTPTEAFRKALQLGLIALHLYSTNEGGLHIVEDGILEAVQLEKIEEDEEHKKLGAFWDYIDGLELD